MRPLVQLADGLQLAFVERLAEPHDAGVWWAVAEQTRGLGVASLSTFEMMIEAQVACEFAKLGAPLPL